jgi:hypothetical protein
MRLVDSAKVAAFGWGRRDGGQAPAHCCLRNFKCIKPSPTTGDLSHIHAFLLYLVYLSLSFDCQWNFDKKKSSLEKETKKKWTTSIDAKSASDSELSSPKLPENNIWSRTTSASTSLIQLDLPYSKRLDLSWHQQPSKISSAGQSAESSRNAGWTQGEQPLLI